MTPAEIIKGVARRHRIPVKLLTGPQRWTELMIPRSEAIAELSAAGLSPRKIGHVMNRDRATVIYWLRHEKREQNNAIYRARRASLGLTVTAALRYKTTADQRSLLAQLYIEGRRLEMFELQAALGLSRDYARKLAGRRHLLLLQPKLEAKPTARVVDVPQPRPLPLTFTPPRRISMQAVALRSSPHTTLTAALLGDPPPGRSALDLRHREARV